MNFCGHELRWQFEVEFSCLRICRVEFRDASQASASREFPHDYELTHVYGFRILAGLY